MAQNLPIKFQEHLQVSLSCINSVIFALSQLLYYFSASKYWNKCCKYRIFNSNYGIGQVHLCA